MKHFTKSKEKLFEEFNTNSQGLSDSEVEIRLKKYGKNILVEKEKDGVFKIFFNQFKDSLVIILLTASVISFFSGNKESTLVIILVLILNSILGTIQSIKAQKSLDSLKKISSPKCKVIRNGENHEIDSALVVPGDIVIVEAGDIVPADGRIIENFSLLVNENSLTGESNSIEKSDEVIDYHDSALGDQINMVFSGSLVNYGRAKVLITETAMKTELGKIATLLDSTVESETPLQKALNIFGKKLTIGIVILCTFIFAVYVYYGNSILDSLLLAVALAVAAIPESLNPIITIILSLETEKLSKENAIVKELKSIEALGSISIICSDKTGTLTQNKMTVEKIFINDELIDRKDLNLTNKTHALLLKFCILCSDATDVVGDPTETALIHLAQSYNYDFKDIRNTNSRLSEIPFDSVRKLMTVSYKLDDKITVFTKGAFDSLVSKFTYYIDKNGQISEINKEFLKKIESTNNSLAEDGLRVLTFALKYTDKEKTISIDDENNYIFLGMIAMIDPPREESKFAVQECIRAGIKPIMITGDHKVTARTIAKNIGIFKEGDMVLEGVELEKMSDEELEKNVDKISVYARVSPEHKIRIVNAWQKLGKICAMTGDGVNDAPALKKANIGIAMGITGTEVSKNAASLILADDNFSTIVNAIIRGRNVYRNIKNSIGFLLSGNTSAILAVMYTSFTNLPIIFSPVQLLFINLLTDSLPSIAVGVEPMNLDILDEKPRDPNEAILTRYFSSKLLFEGLLLATFIIIAFYIGLKDSPAKASTMAFATLCLARLFHGFNYRGQKNVFSIGFFKNKFAILAFLIGLALLNAVLLSPILYKTFGITKLDTINFIQIYTLALIPTIFIQVRKAIKYK
ncbi:MAG: cation-translocating P-type ATPase [Fusobacterium sp.]|uniref:cation-translocating P-type ATPase n=1 Tax=Fusobacterium sp. TaxID=68766 RepID=UPI0026DB0835|nr:cation-translocating P-type ATPase [Fusobacterium sp.]MDO4690871.1 cation-translocating P-type ATPase [Fusobacterium sp.]